MEDKIEQLIKETGADRNTVELILKFTGGDIEGARKIFQSMPKDYLSLKIRFMGHKTHNYGSALITINLQTKKIEETEIIISQDIKASEIDTNLKYEEFKEAIKNYSRTGNVNFEMADRLKEAIKSTEFENNIIKYITKENTISVNDVRILFAELLFKVLTEPNAAVKLDQESIDVFRFTKKKESIQEQEVKKEVAVEEAESPEIEKKEEVEIRSISLVLLKIEPVVSPVKGVSINELSIGDEIMVKIIDERDIGEYLATLLGGKEGENRIPVKAVVKKIEKSPESENIMLLVEFGPGIAGRCFVPEGIKILTPISEELSELKKYSMFSTLNPLWIVLALILLFIIFIIITILSKGEY